MRLRHCLLFQYAVFLVIVAVLSLQVQASQSLTIYAASSLTDAFEELAWEFEQSHPQVEIALNFASSSKLAAQLLAGAPADVFASANDVQMELVVEDGRISKDAVQIFATNQLVLALPADNPAEIADMEDLANKRVLLLLAVTGAPVREYTNAMLVSYNEDHSGDFAQSVLDNLVSEESNVRQVVAKLALGEADAGIVYKTDVVGEIGDHVITISIDRRHNQLASYPIATIADSEQHELAQLFIEFVLSERGRVILHEYGFCAPAIARDELTFELTPEPDNYDIDEDEVETTTCEGT